ncbi:hypothetical protein Leryth_022395 [Lithospermum erythrorhizon]|nr:hypothetical protein Leryth_022395 [Lithospermum erythrorhizon]
MAIGVRVEIVGLIILTMSIYGESSSDTNRVYSPCGDARIQREDGFSFGIAFGKHDDFFLVNGTSSSRLQLSPCDSRLNLQNNNAQLASFRPKVDQISLLTINTSANFQPENYGGYMVAFAGRKYAARSPPAFVANGSYTVSSFTLVLEFQKGRLENLFWKRDGCSLCKGNSNYVCLNNQDCAYRTNQCKRNGSGTEDCSLGIQVAFSGTDKHDAVFNSWYEVKNLRQYSLYGLYDNLRGSLSSQLSNLI